MYRGQGLIRRRPRFRSGVTQDSSCFSWFCIIIPEKETASMSLSVLAGVEPSAFTRSQS